MHIDFGRHQRGLRVLHEPPGPKSRRAGTNFNREANTRAGVPAARTTWASTACEQGCRSPNRTDRIRFASVTCRRSRTAGPALPRQRQRGEQPVRHRGHQRQRRLRRLRTATSASRSTSTTRPSSIVDVNSTYRDDPDDSDPSPEAGIPRLAQVPHRSRPRRFRDACAIPAPRSRPWRRSASCGSGSRTRRCAGHTSIFQRNLQLYGLRLTRNQWFDVGIFAVDSTQVRAAPGETFTVGVINNKDDAALYELPPDAIEIDEVGLQAREQSLRLDFTESGARSRGARRAQPAAPGADSTSRSTSG